MSSGAVLAVTMPYWFGWPRKAPYRPLPAMATGIGAPARAASTHSATTSAPAKIPYTAIIGRTPKLRCATCSTRSANPGSIQRSM